MYKTVLVALDLDDSYEEIFSKGIDIARQNKADLIIAYIDEIRASSDETFVLQLTNYHQENQEKYDFLMKKLETHAHLASIKNVKIIIQPSTTIVREITDFIAKNENVDLIVCGANQKISFGEKILGTTASGIVKYSQCDTFVFKN